MSANAPLVHDGTRAFAFFTAASPSQVWLALTGETQTPDYLYGLALSSEWSADALITTASMQGLPGLTGQVLCAWPTRRLSYLLCASPGPPVYLTWLIRPAPAEASAVCGSTKQTVRLTPRRSKTSGCPSSTRSDGLTLPNRRRSGPRRRSRPVPRARAVGARARRTGPAGR
jgi:hypothetical protein